MKKQNQVGGMKAVAKGLPEVICARVGDLYAAVFRSVVANIRGQYRNVLGWAEAEDIASEAVVYALNTLAELSPEDVTEKGWIALSMFKARCLANSLHRRQASGRAEALWLDASLPGADEGLEGLDASCVVRASAEAWCSQQQDADRAALAAQVYADLDGLYAKCGVSIRAGKIFSAYCLQKEPLERVARRFGISGNVVYVTASRVREKLAELGPAYLPAA